MALQYKLNGYAEDSQRHKHQMCMPKTFNGVTSKLNGYVGGSHLHNHPS